MSYTVKMQKPASYQNKRYGQGTIGSSACGAASVCNCLKNAGIVDVSVPDMCDIAVNCGARVTGGTVMTTLLNTCKTKYGFTYTTTSKNAELVAHLKKGGTAVCWCGGGYSLFSNGGHFVAAVGIDNNGLIIIADSLWYSNKWTYNSIRKSQIITTSTMGLVKCSITALGKATNDRSPSYFLINKQKNETSNKIEGDDEVVIPTLHRVNGKDKKVNAITKDGVTYSSIRELSDALGFKLGWDNNTKTRVFDLDEIKVEVDGRDITVQGISVNNDTNLVGFALLKEMGYQIGYDSVNDKVIVSSPDKQKKNYL